MKLFFALLILVNGAWAQTGPKTTSNTKRVLICCGKATNQTITPSSSSKPVKNSSSNGSKQ